MRPLEPRPAIPTKLQRVFLRQTCQSKFKMPEKCSILTKIHPKWTKKAWPLTSYTKLRPSWLTRQPIRPMIYLRQNLLVSRRTSLKINLRPRYWSQIRFSKKRAPRTVSETRKNTLGLHCRELLRKKVLKRAKSWRQAWARELWVKELNRFRLVWFRRTKLSTDPQLETRRAKSTQFLIIRAR